MLKRDKTLLDAVMVGKKDRIKSLLSNGADIESVDQGGRTALHNAVIDNRLEIVQLLLAHGANVNAVDKRGWTPLHFAAQDYLLELAKLLLENGASVDPQDDFGNTPLSKAVYYSGERGDMIKLLLLYDANRHLKNNYDVSPLSLAETIADVDVKQFFKDGSMVTKAEGKGGGALLMLPEKQSPLDAKPAVTSAGKAEPPLVEFPGDGFKTAFDAICDAMKQLDALDMGDRWITFSGQGQGPREDTYHIEDVRFSGRTFDLKDQKIDLPAIMRSAVLDRAKVNVQSTPDGKIILPNSTPEERARFLDAVFRKHFKLRPFKDVGDYMLGVEWQPGMT